MFPYWLLFTIWTAGAVQFRRRQSMTHHRILFVTATIFTAAMIGLRNNVGGDWGSYYNIYEAIYFQPVGPALQLSDPGYAALNWICAQFDIGIWGVNLICGVIFMVGVARLASRQPNPWLGILVGVPYFIIVVAMGYTRQAAAIGIICFALADASERHLFQLIAYVAVAALFHKTAVLVLPLMLAPILTRNLLAGTVGAIGFAILFGLVLHDSSAALISNYANSHYDSQGAAVRIAMNVVPAVIMLLFRDRMGFSGLQRGYWTYSSLCALMSVPALLTLSASSGVDRLSLFLIPLQIVTYARLPYVVSGSRRANVATILGIIGYSFAVQFVWLNFATNANAWLPYATVIGT